MKHPSPTTDVKPSDQTPRMGACLHDGRVTFTVFSSCAKAVRVDLFTSPASEAPVETHALERSGDLWQVDIPYRPDQPYYVYRMEGPALPAHAFDPKQYLLDPYADAVAWNRSWGDTGALQPGEGLPSGPHFPKAMLIEDEFDWSDEQPPRTPLEDSVVYEAHVRGFTAHPSSGVEQPGTYKGFIEKIPYLQSLGVTAVECLPLHEFNELEFYLEGGPRQGLINYWGYNPIVWAAPQSRYQSEGDPARAIRDLQELVKALHAVGIEVWLDVVFNHTAEGDAEWPLVYNYKGIDAPTYYLLDDEEREFLNFTGCGNTVHPTHPATQELILESLRRWVRRFHIDAFRFDLASALCRGADGAPLEHPPLIERIAEDPVLKECKLIAEPWDAAGLYQVGSFPHARWAEWNGRYRDDIRRFWNGFSEGSGEAATRIAGSADLYQPGGRSPLNSINFITSHDGFTLRDLVRYAHKHNEDNGEDNRDGEAHNFSVALGNEGPTDDEALRNRRRKRALNLMGTLLLSQGVPMLTAGDECGRTQGGNNNAYCQDNERSWFDWTLPEREHETLEYTRQWIALRKAHPALRRTSFFRGPTDDHPSADIDWFGPDVRAPDWHGRRTLGFVLNGDPACTGRDEPDDDLLVILHAEEDPVEYRLPPPPRGGAWTLALSTDGIDTIGDKKELILQVPGDTLAVFIAEHKTT